jgi:hypothetical protein
MHFSRLYFQRCCDEPGWTDVPATMPERTNAVRTTHGLVIASVDASVPTSVPRSVRGTTSGTIELRNVNGTTA